MPLFAAALIVARRRTATVAVPVTVPAPWSLLGAEVVAALRAAWMRIVRRARSR
jgi:hypothetical protein